MSEREYEIGKWYPWNGGECPVPDAKVSFKMANGHVNEAYPANSLLWRRDGDGGDIIAFCVTEYPVEGVERKESVFLAMHDNPSWSGQRLATYHDGELVKVHWEKEENK